MEYIHQVDFDAVDSSGPDERVILRLLNHDSGTKHCTINYIKTPPGGGTPGGHALHTHDVDQIFYILSGTMNIDIEGKQYECSRGSLIFFPAGVPHYNWNGGSEATIHLAFNTPLPDPDTPFMKLV